MRIKHFSLSFGSQLFKAFSDEARIRILFLIFSNEKMCSSDLEHILDYTQTKTSRHLSYLKNAGIINFKRTDQFIYYYIKDELKDIVNQLFQYLNKDQTLLNDLETYRILYSNRELAICKTNAGNLNIE